jgi:hypothetical protein
MRFVIADILKNKNKLHLFVIILFFWISLWLSIGSYPNDIFGQNFNSIINGLRNINALIFSFFLFIYIFVYYIKNLFKVKIKILNIFILFVFYFLLQFIGLYQNNLVKFDVNIFFLPILSIATLIPFFIIKIYKIKYIEKFLLYISIFFLFLLTLIIFYIVKDQINLIDNNYLYRLIPLDRSFLNNTLPRITGFARSIAILNLFLIICLFFVIKNNISKIVIMILTALLSLTLWTTQSRGAILCFIVVNILILIFSSKKLLKLFLFSIIFIGPIMTYETHLYNKNLYIEKYLYLNNNNKDNEYLNLPREKLRVTDSHTSGRTVLWKQILTAYDKKKIFGYGPQADRLLISGDLTQSYGNNISNALLYSFACGGYFSLFIFLLIYTKLTIYLYKMIFIYRVFYIKNFINEKISVSLMLFFIVRSFFENSFAVFSVDYLIFMASLFIINQFLKKYNQNY